MKPLPIFLSEGFVTGVHIASEHQIDMKTKVMWENDMGYWLHCRELEGRKECISVYIQLS